MEGKCVKVVINGHVAEVILNRPKKLNAMSNAFFTEMGQAAELINKDPEIHGIYIKQNMIDIL